MKTLTRAHRASRRSRETGSLLGDEGGWTFIETLIVIAIIMILSSSVGFVAYRYVERAKSVAARNQIETYALALDSYFVDCAGYPTQEQGLRALWEKPTVAPVPEGWNGPYVGKPVQKDPWGGEYQYSIPGASGLPFGIRSLGADGKEGGDGKDRDISSWEN
jgi:general secretion pathway protein G